MSRAQGCVVPVVYVGSHWQSAVGSEDFVKVDFHGADIGRSNEADSEEAEGPVSEQVDTLVAFQHVTVLFEVPRVYRLEETWQVSAVACCEGGR